MYLVLFDKIYKQVALFVFMEECIFCRIAKGLVGNKEDFIYENDNFFSVFDIKQEAKGHALVISKKHFDNTLELPVSLGTELLDAIKNVVSKSFKDKSVEGFNVIGNNFPVAGQVINHFHVHILPRRRDDGIKFV